MITISTINYSSTIGQGTRVRNGWSKRDVKVPDNSKFMSETLSILKLHDLCEDQVLEEFKVLKLELDQHLRVRLLMSFTQWVHYICRSCEHFTYL